MSFLLSKINQAVALDNLGAMSLTEATINSFQFQVKKYIRGRRRFL